MKPDLYNERTARMHYKRFREILYSPSVLNLSSDITDSLSATLNSVIKPSEADSTAAQTLSSQPQTETQHDSNANRDSHADDSNNDAAETPQDATNVPDSSKDQPVVESAVNAAEASDANKDNKDNEANQHKQDKEIKEVKDDKEAADVKQAQEAKEAKDAEDEYIRMVKEFQDVIKDAKRSIAPPSMDRDTISLDAVH